MSLFLKSGVDLRGMTPQAVVAVIVAEEVYEGHGYPCRVTSVYRAEAMLHTAGNAVDFGIRDGNGEVYPEDVIDSILEELHRRIGKKFGGQYDVVDERSAPGGPHIHVEFDPR
jgi:D-alanyl-D-alanine dipeptidase